MAKPRLEGSNPSLSAMFFTTRRSGGFEPETPPDGRGHSFRQNHEGRNVPEERDFRSASGGDEAGRAMAWTA